MVISQEHYEIASSKGSDPNFLLDGCLGSFRVRAGTFWLSFLRLKKLSSCFNDSPRLQGDWELRLTASRMMFLATVNRESS